MVVGSSSPTLPCINLSGKQVRNPKTAEMNQMDTTRIFWRVVGPSESVLTATRLALAEDEGTCNEQIRNSRFGSETGQLTSSCWRVSWCIIMAPPLLVPFPWSAICCRWLSSGVVEGVGVDTLDSLCIELSGVVWVVSLVARICSSSVTGWGADSGKCGTGGSTVWNFVNLAKVFRFLQQSTPHRLHRHWDRSLLQHMAIRVNGKTHQVVR